MVVRYNVGYGLQNGGGFDGGGIGEDEDGFWIKRGRNWVKCVSKVSLAMKKELSSESCVGCGNCYGRRESCEDGFMCCYGCGS